MPISELVALVALLLSIIGLTVSLLTYFRDRPRVRAWAEVIWHHRGEHQDDLVPMLRVRIVNLGRRPIALLNLALWGGTGPITSEINQWVGRAIALVEASGADVTEISSLRVCSQGLASSIRNQNAHAIATIVHSALGRAELKVPASAQGAFIAAGDTLDAFAAVAKVLARAKVDILMVDAYADQTIITDFAVTAPENIVVRILGANRETR